VLQGQAQLGKLPSVGGSSGLDGKTIWAALKQTILSNFGDTGWGAVALSLTGELFPSMTFGSFIYWAGSEIYLADNKCLYHSCWARSA
jgi:hypothetical protein